MIDFYRPDGTPVAVVRGDPRQLNDATFHAGTGSGSAYEYVDTFNKLHFYVLGTRRGDDGVLRYQLAVRRNAEGDPFRRNVAVGQPVKTGRPTRLPRDVPLPGPEHGQAATARSGRVRGRTCSSSTCSACRRRRAATAGR